MRQLWDYLNGELTPERGGIRDMKLLWSICLLTALSTPVTAQTIALGPADGRDLPAVDTSRVRAGKFAPDFTLESMTGGTVTLSQYRGKKNVILVFYRGHW